MTQAAAGAWRWAVRAAALLLAALLLAPGLRAQELRPVPALSGRVIDQTGTLGAAQREALEAKLAAFEAQAGPQIVVLIVPATAPEDIAAYTQRVGETWKIGRREVGDGLLLVVAKDERRLWIAPAKALEGAVPDLAARQIVRDLISPAFKAGDYAGGLDRGVDALIARIRGENLPQPAAPPAADDGGPQLEELMIFFFVAVPVISAVLSGLFGRKLGALLTGGAAGAVAGWVTHSVLLGLAAGLVALVLVGVFGLGAAARRVGIGRRRPGLRGGWSGGLGTGGSGGWAAGGGSGGFGGFSSGGGGDFGGGGAGGDW